MHASALTGEIALILFLAARSRDRGLLLQVLRELGQTLTEAEAQWVLKIVRTDLDPGDRDWLEGTLRQMHFDPHNRRKMPYTAWLWHPQNEVSVRRVVPCRLTETDYEQLRAIACRDNISVSEFLRRAVKSYVEQRSQAD